MPIQPVCFGRYVLVDRIAAGGMGEVFLGVPRSLWGLEKLYAIKKVLPRLSRNPEFLERFRHEARLVISMNHPNVVQVLEVGRVEDDYFIAMELVEGQSLAQVLARCCRRRRPLPVPAALFVVRELLAGLEYCHRHTDAAGHTLGMVHRDVSPSNVLISYDGAVKLGDFGLALSSLKHYQTQPDALLGHLGYLAPEAMEGQRQDRRADIFSAGVLLFELLTAQRFCAPLDLDTVRESLRARTQAPVPLSELRAGVPSSLDVLVNRAVAWDPDERHPSARVFHDEVQRELVKLDPFFDAASLSEKVMHRLFAVDTHRARLRDLLRRLDLDAVASGRPTGRSVCLGEAIPLRTDAPRGDPDSDAGLLTLSADVADRDTEPLALRVQREASGGAPAGLSSREPPRPAPPSRLRRVVTAFWTGRRTGEPVGHGQRRRRPRFRDVKTIY